MELRSAQIGGKFALVGAKVAGRLDMDATSIGGDLYMREVPSQAKFDNVLNFRGFPHVPGNDQVLSYPDAQS